MPKSPFAGKSLEFDRNAWVDTGYLGVAGGKDRTVACWIRMADEKKAKIAGPIVTWGYGRRRDAQGDLIAGKAWMLSVAPHKSKAPEDYGVLRLNVGDHTAYGTTNLRDGSWHHVAVVTIDEDYGTSLLLYIDGQLESTRHDVVQAMDTKTDASRSRPVQFGRHLFVRDRYLEGALDEMYLFDGALSGDEIRELMSRGTGP